jgi:methyltransferase
MMFLLSAAVVATMAAEGWRARRNERRLRERGGVEPCGDVYPLMRVAYPAAFAVMLIEGTRTRARRAGIQGFGIGLFLLAKALKWWAIRTLGPFWTFRVIVMPRHNVVTAGPYAYLKHPNYVAVAGELLGVAFASGARRTGPAATLGFGLLMRRRIAVEERAIREAWSAAVVDQVPRSEHH